MLGVIDGDLQHPPEVLLRLYQRIQTGADLAVASRHVAGGGVSSWSMARRVLSRGAQMLGLLLLPEAVGRVSDPMSGYFLVRRSAIAGPELHPLGYKILLEVIAPGAPGRFRPRADDAGRVIETVAEDGIVLNVDRLRAEQAVGNLVDNALRHGRGRIVVEALRGGDTTIELHVRDAGPGFAPDLVARAFEPFSRGDAARTGPGAGLGLAIVDVIARAHGGSAHVESADAWIVLPGKS